MIETIKVNNKTIEYLDKPVKNTWLNIINPTDSEINNLSKLLKIKEEDYTSFSEDIRSLQDEEEIPFMERWDEGEIFIITRTPQKTNKAIEYTTVPLGILITKNFVITVSYGKNEIVEKLKLKKLSYDKILIVLKALLLSSRTYLQYLKNIDKKIQTIEKKLDVAQRNQEIKNLLDIKKSLVYFNTSLKNDEILIERMAKTSIFISKEENKDLIDDVIDENKQAIEMTNIYSNIIKDTLEVFSSVISNNLNRVMKLLTAITIIIAIPTLISSIYGMNVLLPFQNSPFAFVIVALLSLGLTFIGLYTLWKYKLLY